MKIEILIYRPGIGEMPYPIVSDTKSTVEELRALIAHEFKYPFDEILLSLRTDTGMIVLRNGTSLQEYELGIDKFNLIDCRKLPAQNLVKLNNPGMEGLLRNSVLQQNQSILQAAKEVAIQQQNP